MLKSPITLLELYEIISANLYAQNITDAQERLATARVILAVIEDRITPKVTA